MNPPSEQLVRDYLNRLSVAAGRLGLADRQGLLDRTRARIEVESGGLRDATADEVRKALTGLGDPIAVVEREQARIAAMATHRDAGIGGLFGGRRIRVVRQLWPDADSEEAGGSGVAAGSDAAAGSADAPRREMIVRPAEPVGGEIIVGSAGPVAVGSEVTAQAAARLAAVPVASAIPAWPTQPNGEPHRPNQPGSDGGVAGTRGPEADGSSGRGRAPAGPPPQSARSGDTGAAANPPNLPPAQPREPPPDRDASSTPASASAPIIGGGTEGDDEPASGIELSLSGVEPIVESERGRLAGVGGVFVDWLSRVGNELVNVLVRDRLEAIAIVLLGFGGAAFPPVWLGGALLALFSRKWDHRDKWLGLAVPVLLMVFGAMLVVVLGGQRLTLGAYATEFWLAAGRLSRLAAVLGAGYLLSRAIKYQGKPGRRQPPWSQPAARR